MYLLFFQSTGSIGTTNFLTDTAHKSNKLRAKIADRAPKVYKGTSSGRRDDSKKGNRGCRKLRLRLNFEQKSLISTRRHTRVRRAERAKITKGQPRLPFCDYAEIYRNQSFLTILAISSAKFSSRFAIPSPLSKRWKAVTLMEPPNSLAVAATYLATVRESSLT